MAAVALVIYWGLCAERAFGSEEMVRVWWEKIVEWEAGVNVQGRQG